MTDRWFYTKSDMDQWPWQPVTTGIATFFVAYLAIVVGFGYSGLMLEHFGAGFHTSENARRIVIDSAALGLLMGFTSSILLAVLAAGIAYYRGESDGT